MGRRSLALAVLCIGALFALPVLAQADTGNIIEPQHTPGTAADGWQAGNCSTDEPEAGEPKVKCSPEIEGAFFKKAGGHPPIGFTQYIIQHTHPIPGVIEPIVEPLEGRDIKTLRVDLPPGLTVNPEATGEKCTLAEFLHSPAPGVFVPECKPATKTGEEQATVVVNEEGFELEPGKPLPLGARIPLIPGVFQIPVYNLVPNSLSPESREPALFGFVVAGKEPIFLRTEVSWESDYHESFTIHIPAEAEGTGLQTLISRLVSFGQATGNGTYITNPTTCFDPEESSTEHLYSTWFRAESFEEPNPTFPNGLDADEAPLPEGVRQSGCPKVPFEPEIEVEPGATEVDSPARPAVTTEMPFEVPSGGEHEIGPVAAAQRRGDDAGRDGPEPVRLGRSRRLHRRRSSTWANGSTRTAARLPRRSARAEIVTPLLSEPADRRRSTSANRRAPTRPRATSSGCWSKPTLRTARDRRCVWSARSAPTRPPDS